MHVNLGSLHIVQRVEARIILCRTIYCNKQTASPLHGHPLLRLLTPTNSTSSARIEQPLPIQHLGASLAPPVAAATQTCVEYKGRDREPDGRPHEREHGPAQIATDVEVRSVLEDGAEQGEQRSGDYGSSGREESCEEGGDTGNEGTGIGEA